ncbi:MAG: bifunctional hydroxymethylpyrimidine kinase/phosphomethylpyrimidine kinase [Nitrospirota bacterium]
MKIALTIAGSDPTGGAGLQADLRVFRAFGVHGLSVVSAITAQNTKGVDSVLPVEKNFFERQLHVLLSDIIPDTIKIGMLYSSWAVELVAEILKGYSLSNLVIDPVTVSSSGISLIENGTLDALREKLFPLSKVITPNIYEASVLTGITIEDREDMEKTAKVLKDMGPEVVVITGGLLEEVALDLFYDGNLYDIEGLKIEGEYHGTGCAFSAAIAALLALGHIPLESVRGAKEFMDKAIKKAHHPGKGMGLLYI